MAQTKETNKVALTHWADQVVKRVIAQKGDKEKYVCAAGITPSGIIHVGNFREIITVDLVSRAFKDAGKKSRFIYSWDDYDVFRKVPANMPNQEMLQTQLRKAIVDIADPYGTEENYARHHEVKVEKAISKVGIYPEFLYQAKKYRNLEYIQGIKTALKNAKKIKEILDEYRQEPLAEDWLPISGYCPECEKDTIKFSNYDGDDKIHIKCNSCSFDQDIEISKSGLLKLPWRIDWPMRWNFEQVDFEPGGKDHSTPGGSYSTGQEIVKLYGWTAPSYQMYDFIRIKGGSGKISSSSGDVVTLDETLDIYEPTIARWLFAGTRPNAEFAISFDLDVIKIYEDFDKCERIYFDQESVKEKEAAKQKRIYQLSCPHDVPTKIPFQPSFRHLTNVLQINSFNMDAVVESYKDELKTSEDKERLILRATCARNWIEKYAPEDFKFSVQSTISDDFKASDELKSAMKEVIKLLREKQWTEKDLHNAFYDIMKNNNLETKDFFTACYNILIQKEKGPKLANFIITIGQEKVAQLFEQIKSH